MSDWQEHLPEDLEETASRLRAERPQASPLDLDRVKLSVRRKSRGGMPVVGGLRTKLLAPILSFGIMGGGSTAVVLADGHDNGKGNDGNNEGNGKNASKSQYCPPQGSHGSVAAQHCTQKPPPKSSKSNKSNRGSHNSHTHGHGNGDS